MYIDQLIVKNIASLRGEHKIDFQNILAKDGLFAITGPTGSGKSTLLSAISLALYGQGGKKGLFAKDYVSEGAPSAEVTLFFRIDDHRYKAYWNCSVLKKDGTPRAKPTTKSYIEDNEIGQILETNATELTKLTLEQFNQCVILHQGEFAKFLTSSFSERRSILEKLVNITELEGIKEAYLLKYHALDKSIATMSERLEGSELFTKEELAQLEEQKEKLESKSKHLKLKNNAFLKTKEIYHKLLEYHNTQEQMSLKLTQATKNLDEHTKDYQESFLEFREFEDTLKKEEETWENERTQLNHYVDLQNIISTKKELRSREILQKEELTKRTQALQLKNTQTKNQLQGLTFKWDGETLKWLNLERENIINALATLESVERAKEELERNQSKLSSQLKDIEIAANQIKETLSSDQDDISVTEEKIQDIVNQLIGLEKEKSVVATNIELTKVSINQYQSLHEQLSQLNTKLKSSSSTQILEELIHKNEDLLIRERQIATHANAIRALKELSEKKDSCELCGNPHPDFSNFKVESNQEIEQKIATALAELTKLKNDYKSRQQLELDNIKYEEQHKVLIEELAKTLSCSTKEISDLKNIELRYQQLVDKGLSLSRNQSKLTETKIHLERKWKHEVVEKEKLQGLRNQYKNIKGELQKSDDALIKMNQDWTKSLEQNPFIAQELKKGEILTKIRESIYLNLANLEKSQLLEENLNSSQAEIEKNTIQCQEMIKNIELTSIEIDETLEKVPSEYREIKIVDYIREREEHFKSQKEKLWGDHQKISEKKLACERAKEAISHIKENLKTSATWISKYAQDLREESKELELHNNIEDIDYDSTKLFIKDHFDLSELNASQLEELIKIKLTPLVTKSNELLEDVKTTQSQVSSKLELHQAKATAAQALAKELNEQKKKFELMQNMKDFFWRNDFKNYVLSMIETELIYITNDELSKLCEGRYQLKSVAGTNGPEFVVIDSWISLSERKVASLSGGETFMVSLALALGLAEMTRGKTRIDSFFIDEGFGSLDPETLESVSQVLLNLRGRGKTIGIISHVEALTSKLPRSLRLNKLTGGDSTLSYQEMAY